MKDCNPFCEHCSSCNNLGKPKAQPNFAKFNMEILRSHSELVAHEWEDDFFHYY